MDLTVEDLVKRLAAVVMKGAFQQVLEREREETLLEEPPPMSHWLQPCSDCHLQRLTSYTSLCGQTFTLAEAMMMSKSVECVVCNELLRSGARCTVCGGTSYLP